ncbi:hypothetical protein BDZ94DRAFT_1308626 [Collybia nuda]|uniref:Uncharacterized protein n=1 Tax=Collybia nuda TaxID=64659 RepID=A0A9P5Y553_9AGAR|nr:hypothetical protein BDZ94DRAFT_1308626 [Collybia nuda]
MFTKLAGIFTIAAMTLGSVSNAARTRWYTTRSCDGGAALDYQNLGARSSLSLIISLFKDITGCNVCVDPALDWYAVLIEGVGSDQRISSHNQNSCTPRSQVGQFYGPACNTAGATAIRSMWIACPGQKLMNENTTFITLDDTKPSGIAINTNTDF